MSILSQLTKVEGIEEETNKESRHEMRKKYHGIILRTIAQQKEIFVDGEPIRGRLAINAWKEYFRNLFHPGKSTEDMTDEEFSDLINTVEAHGAQELGVTFPPAP